VAGNTVLVAMRLQTAIPARLLYFTLLYFTCRGRSMRGGRKTASPENAVSMNTKVSKPTVDVTVVRCAPPPVSQLLLLLL